MHTAAGPAFAADDIRADIKAQMTSRVRWTESIQAILNSDVDHFYEFGSGTVLTGLVKRINRKTQRFNRGESADFQN